MVDDNQSGLLLSSKDELFIYPSSKEQLETADIDGVAYKTKEVLYFKDNQYKLLVLMHNDKEPMQAPILRQLYLSTTGEKAYREIR